MSFLYTIEQGQILEHITQQDLSPSDIVSLSQTSKVINRLMTASDRSSRIWTPFIPREPFSNYPVSIIFTRVATAYAAFDLHAVSLGSRTVIRIQQCDYTNLSAEILFLRELQAWFHLLLHSRFERVEKLTPDLTKAYKCQSLLDTMARYNPKNVESSGALTMRNLRELCDLISFDALKSFLSINFSEDQARCIDICISQFKESMQLKTVSQDPVGALTFFSRIANAFLSQSPTPEQLREMTDLSQSIISLPRFSFTLFNRFFLREIKVQKSAAIGIKCLTNCLHLMQKGSLTFDMIGELILIDSDSALNIHHFTNAFYNAVARGFISLDQHNHLFYDNDNILLFLREDTELDRRLNQTYQELQSQLSARPDYKERRQYWGKMLDVIFRPLLQSHIIDNIESDINSNHEHVRAFARSLNAGQLTTQNLFNLMTHLHETQRQVFETFISTQSETLRKEPFLFSYFLMRSLDLLKELPDFPEDLNQLLHIVTQEPDVFVQNTFSKNGLAVLAKLSQASLQALLTQMIEQSFLSETKTEPSVISFIATALVDFERKKTPAHETEALLLNFIRCFESIRPLLNDPHHPIGLTPFKAALSIVCITADINRAKKMVERFMNLPRPLLQGNIAFLRQSLLEILHRHFGSTAASHYFMELSYSDNYSLIKALFLLSLDAITPQQWISSIEHFITFIYQFNKVEMENGETVTDHADFNDFFDNFIEETMKSVFAGENPDLKAIIAKVEDPDYDSDDSDGSEDEA
ncbi:MAG: hypothetical protein KBF71_08280 [Alphaproteobacteria bacterium]|jgi:hypothetical protein|nr:hypothetical protein [Alphaproteobacteria bacterium]